MCQHLSTETFVEIGLTERNGDILINSKLDIEDVHKRGCFIELNFGKPQNRHEKLNIFHFVQKRKQSNWKIL